MIAEPVAALANELKRRTMRRCSAQRFDEMVDTHSMRALGLDNQHPTVPDRDLCVLDALVRLINITVERSFDARDQNVNLRVDAPGECSSNRRQPGFEGLQRVTGCYCRDPAPDHELIDHEHPGSCLLDRPQHLDDPFVHRIAIEPQAGCRFLHGSSVVSGDRIVRHHADGKRLMSTGHPGEVVRLHAAAGEKQPRLCDPAVDIVAIVLIVAVEDIDAAQFLRIARIVPFDFIKACAVRAEYPLLVSSALFIAGPMRTGRYQQPRSEPGAAGICIENRERRIEIRAGIGDSMAVVDNERHGPRRPGLARDLIRQAGSLEHAPCLTERVIPPCRCGGQAGFDRLHPTSGEQLCPRFLRVGGHRRMVGRRLEERKRAMRVTFRWALDAGYLMAIMERELGPWSAYALVAGGMIGTGIFFFVSPVAVEIGSAPGILFVWTAGIAIAACGAACVSELAAAYPETGGVYVYLSRAFGPLIGFLYTWSKFLVMRVGSLGVATLAFAEFSAQAFGIEEAGNRSVIAVAALWSVTAVNLAGARAGGAIQVFLTALKLVALLLMIALGTCFAAGLIAPHDIEIETTAAIREHGVAGWALALIPVMWTLGGWDESPFAAGETINPDRNLPLSVLGGLISVGLLFVLINAAYLAVLSPDEMAASGTRTATLFMQRALGPVAARILAVVLMVSTLGVANGVTLTGARIAYAAGRDHALFAPLAVMDPATGSPARALVFQAGLTTAAIVVLWDPFDLLVYTAMAYWLFAALTGMAVIVLRRTDPDTRRPFRAPGHPLLPSLFVSAASAMTCAAIVENPLAALINFFLILIGVVVFLLQRREGVDGAR